MLELSNALRGDTTPMLQANPSPQASLKAEAGMRPSISGADARREQRLVALWRAFWLGLTVVIHAMWGLYPVACRWLQTRSQPPLPPLRLTFFINLAGCISLAACYNLPRALGRLARSHSSSAAAAASEETSPLFPGGQVAIPEGEWSRRRLAAHVAGLALSLGVLAAAAVAGSRLTSAYWVQLIFNTSPLMTALLAEALLGAPPPPKLLPTLLLTIAGTALVVAGGMRSATRPFSGRDLLGMLMALAATLAISVYFVLVAKTRGRISDDQILYLNYIAVFSFAPLLSALFEGGSWAAVLHWTLRDWLLLLYAGAGVYGVAKFTQQVIIRHDGPAEYAMFISVRVVAAIAGSWLLLGEGISNWLEAAGCLVVILSVSWYLWVQWRTRQEALGLQG